MTDNTPTPTELVEKTRKWANSMEFDADAAQLDIIADDLEAVTAERDADKWDEGKRAMTEWKQGHPLPPNPYRIERKTRA